MDCVEKYSGTLTALFTLGLLIVAWIQVNKFRDQVKADFLYRIYKDMLEWLKNHKEVRDWIFETKETLTREKYESWELDEFLSFFEMIWSFDKKGLVDQDTVYDLFSDFLISAYEANDFALKKIIQVLRKEEHKNDLYIGVKQLYKKMKALEKEK
jgi:hypothetical protein